MKKFIFGMIAAFAAITANAQSNYSGSSKFTDNMSITVQGGVLTKLNDFYTTHPATTPIIIVGVDKYITPVFGVGIEGRTLIQTGSNNTHTAFDYVNVSGYLKANLANMFTYKGKRHVFEPVIYTGLGWGHGTAKTYPLFRTVNSSNVLQLFRTANPSNVMTYRAGTEFNFNLGKSRNFALVLNPSVVWGDLDNGKLCKKNGNFEVTAGFVYHFKTSNGTSSFVRARLYDQNEVNTLNDKINSLRKDLDNANATIEVLKTTKPKEVVKYIYPKVQFLKGSAKVTETSMANIYDIADSLKAIDGTIKITGYASTEGTTKFNKSLSLKRAEAVKKLLTQAGVPADKIEVSGAGATNKFNPDELNTNRVVVVE